MGFTSKAAASKLMLNEAGQSKAGSHVAWVAAWEAEATPRLCRPVPWDTEVSEAQETSVAALAEASGDVTGDSAVAEASTTEVASTAVAASETVEAASTAAETATSAVPTALLLRMPPMAPVVVGTEASTATTGAADLVLAVVAVRAVAAVGIAVRVVVAHLMTDLAAEVSATATHGNLEATWSPSDLAGRMVGTRTLAGATETTTARETMTIRGSVATMVATKIPGSSDATNKTNIANVLWWVSNSSHFRNHPPLSSLSIEGKPTISKSLET